MKWFGSLLTLDFWLAASTVLIGLAVGVLVAQPWISFDLMPWDSDGATLIRAKVGYEARLSLANEMEDGWLESYLPFEMVSQYGEKPLQSQPWGPDLYSTRGEDPVMYYFLARIPRTLVRG
jgi:hypothetical protein